MFLRIRNLVEPVSRGISSATSIRTIHRSAMPAMTPSNRTESRCGVTIDEEMPGARIDSPNGIRRRISGEVSWHSHYPINHIELVHNGSIAQRKAPDKASQSGAWTFDIEIETDGWVAARAYGEARDSFAQAIYAHTSPVYIGTGRPNRIAQESAAFFVRSIDDSIDWVSRIGKFHKKRTTGGGFAPVSGGTEGLCGFSRRRLAQIVYRFMWCNMTQNRIKKAAKQDGCFF